MSEGSRYMLALVQETSGAFQKIDGRIEVRGGKAERIEIPATERAMWLEIIKAARVALEAEGGGEEL